MSKEVQPHQQRVIDEYHELLERYRKLEDFFDTEVYAGLDLAEQDRMLLQWHAMNTYRQCLRLRVEAMGHGDLLAG